MAKRYDVAAATVAWMKEEAEHQAGKYPLAEDVNLLAKDGVLYGRWGNQLYTNYTSRVAAPWRGQNWPQALQAAGKHAGVPRGLYVMTQVLLSPLDLRIADQEAAETASYAVLADEASEHEFDYTHVANVMGTPFDTALQELHDSLPRPFCRTGMHDVSEAFARQALLEGYYYFLDKTAWVTAALGELVLPAPGVASGEYQPWPRAEEFVIA
jgi:hypothetical protein